MTAKQILKNTQIELNKVNAPALKLYEFNYYLNKAINQYVNIVYNTFDVNQQTTDDLRVLQGSVYLTPKLVSKSDKAIVNDDDDSDVSSPLSSISKYSGLQSLYGAAYECWLPADYLHMLNCVCTFKVTSPYDCYDEGSYVQKAATRLTSDAWPMVIDDVYNRPSPERPYYQIYNQHRDPYSGVPTDPVIEKSELVNGYFGATGTDINGEYGVTSYDSNELADGTEAKAGGNQPRTFTFNNGYKMSLVEKTAAQRVSNPSGVRLEIRYGRDNTLFVLKEVQVDYIKAPQYIRLTQEQLDLTQDVSQIMEWPEYVCQEIINILVRLLMERSQDPRIANNSQINQTIVRGTAQSQASA